MNGYPLTLVNLHQARCIVIGGGEVAARKVAALQEAGAQPVVISPVLCPALEQQAACGSIHVLRRVYQQDDLEGARLVIAATDDPRVNEAVWREAEARGCLVNVVDDPPHCNFYVPATVRRGSLTISISTGGACPSLSRRIREELDEEFDAAYEPYLMLLGELRPLIREQVPTLVLRKAAWQALLNADILDLIRAGADESARHRAYEILSSFCQQG